LVAPGLYLEDEIVRDQILAVALRDVAGFDDVSLPPGSTLPPWIVAYTFGPAVETSGLFRNRIGVPDRMPVSPISSTLL